MPLRRHLPRVLAAALALAFLLQGTLIPAAIAGEQVTAQAGHAAAHDGNCCGKARCDCGYYSVSIPLMSPPIASQAPSSTDEPLPACDSPRAAGSQAAPFRPPA